MRYYRLLDNVHIVNRWYLGDVTSDTGEPPLRHGIPFNRALSAEITSPGTPLRFCLTSFAVPVVAGDLALAISKLTDTDTQSIPLEIAGHSGYRVLNVLRVVDCLDETRSEFMKWTKEDHRADLAGQYRMVTRLKIDPARVPAGIQIFRITGWLIAMIVSENVKDAMEQHDCFGAKFQPV